MGCSQVTVAPCGLVDTGQYRLVRFGLVCELDRRFRVGLQRSPESDSGFWVDTGPVCAHLGCQPLVDSSPTLRNQTLTQPHITAHIERYWAAQIAGSVRVSTLIDSLGDRRYVRTPHLGAKVLSGGRGTGGSTGRPWSAALPLLYVPGFDLHEDVLACRAVKRSPGPSLSLRLAGSSSQFRESRRSGRNRPLRDC